MFNKIGALKEPYKKHKKLFISYAIFLVFSFSMGILTAVSNGKVIDALVDNKGLDAFFKILLVYFIFVIIKLGSDYFNGIFKSKFVEKMKHDAKIGILDKLRGSDILKQNKEESAYLANRLENDLTVVINFFTEMFIPTIIGLIQVAIIFYLAFRLDVVSAISMLIIIPLLLLVFNKFKEKLVVQSGEVKEVGANYFNDFNAQILHLEDSVERGNYKKDNNYFTNSFLNYFKSFYVLTKTSLGFNFAVTLIAIGIQFIILYVGAHRVFNGIITVGDITILLNFSGTIINVTSQMGDFFKEKQQMQPSKEKIDEYYSLHQVSEGDKLLEYVEDITADITYGFEDNEKLYSNLKLIFSKENIYGILGGNGTGKSTLYKILTGVIKDNSNSAIDLKYGENDIKDINTISLRKNHLYIVKQYPETYISSVKYFFSFYFGLSSKDEVLTTLRANKIECLSLVDKYLSNWESNINELSGGDKTFLFILGSFISGKDLLVYDEPTANLDQKRKEWFLDCLNKIKHDKIIIVVTHDKDVINKFDIIYNLDDKYDTILA